MEALLLSVTAAGSLSCMLSQGHADDYELLLFGSECRRTSITNTYEACIDCVARGGVEGETKVGGAATHKSIFDVRSISRHFLIIWASASIVVNPSVVGVCCKKYFKL